MGRDRLGNDIDFSNRDFWNKRYLSDPELGSGIGSRGSNLLHKRAIIEAYLLSTRPDSILDVGCGDHRVLADVDLGARYLGVDVSDEIVEINRRKYPDRNFRRVNLAEDAELQQAMRSDVVLCFEVLIHQHVEREYRRLVANLVKLAARGGLISGYVDDPRPAVASEIIAYHEPVTSTLSSAGATDIRMVGRSLESDCLAFVSFHAPRAKD